MQPASESVVDAKWRHLHPQPIDRSIDPHGRMEFTPIRKGFGVSGSCAYRNSRETAIGIPPRKEFEAIGFLLVSFGRLGFNFTCFLCRQMRFSIEACCKNNPVD